MAIDSHLAFTTSGRIVSAADGQYWVVGSDIPILVAGSGSTDDATRRFSDALMVLGRYLVSTRGTTGAADYLARHGVKDYDIVGKDGTKVFEGDFKVAVSA